MSILSCLRVLDKPAPNFQPFRRPGPLRLGLKNKSVTGLDAPRSSSPTKLSYGVPWILSTINSYHSLNLTILIFLGSIIHLYNQQVQNI